jgi:hypothetical protein
MGLAALSSEETTVDEREGGREREREVHMAVFSDTTVFSTLRDKLNWKFAKCWPWFFFYI